MISDYKVNETSLLKNISYEFLSLKVEESGEGFDPPTEIRTIFVPIENAINIPETFDINLGTSFGYNRYVMELILKSDTLKDANLNCETAIWGVGQIISCNFLRSIMTSLLKQYSGHKAQVQ